MPFHWPNKNNRSQHNLVGSTAEDDAPGSVVAGSATATGSSPNPSAGGAANPPSAALSNPAFSSTSESFQAHSQQPPPPPQHLVNLYNSTAAGPHPTNISQLQHSNTVTGSTESRQRDQGDFADQVTRSQSQRFPGQASQISPVSTQYPPQQQQLQQQQQQQLSLGSPSAEDLSAPGASNIPSPIAAQAQLQQQQQQQQQQQYYPQQQLQQPQPQPQRTKQSTRKLIKNILSGSSSSRGPDSHQHLTRDSFGNSSGLSRRESKRQIDWQNQPQQQFQSSPLQNQGEFRRESFVVTGPDQELHLHNHNGLGQPNPTIRSVPPTDSETNSPYSPDDLGYHHHRQSHLQLQGQTQSDLQHPQYSQQAFDPNQQQQQDLSPQQQQYQQYQNQQQLQYQGGNQPVFTGHLASLQQQQNPETISQLSRESPVSESDHRSTNNLLPPQHSPAAYPAEPHDHPAKQNPPPVQGQSSQQQAMAPPTGGAPPPRRSQETEKGIQPPPGPPPSYRQSQAPNMNNPLPPPPPSAGGAPQNYRPGAVADRPQFDGQGEGRNSPQPNAAGGGGEDPEKAFKDLRTNNSCSTHASGLPAHNADSPLIVTKYKNVKRLYFDGKKEIESLNSQVEQLQNAIANQRMSQSRTSLDDNEYTTRFNRLNGAINNLSFNIRKDWVTLPSWLDPFVSADAIKTGKQEMTAVGRAVITRWLVDEIFNRCFHPGLNFELSRQLKAIEQNIRHFSYKLNSQEEYDALTSKVVSWRMATLEGLQDVLRSGESATHKADFTQAATNSLTNCLFQHLSDPPPPGVDGSAGMIVELAVGIAANLPMESRDVAIVYPLPEQHIDPHIMEVEKAGLPALESRSSDAGEDGTGEEGGGKDVAKDAKDRRGDKGRTAPPPPAKGSETGKVRFAGFVGVEVRGRQVLVRAPVWTL
ncbi:hypothetical protein B0T14DRAFT_167715 [Immersiella caudata]|uniref:S-adenosylmethionine-dependent methyltransferase-like protein n=1 Tax=Immersiella caudata TaxID=314043 RepID=A0AA39WX11_9PEZI|nr:hypothetical protein B0T14DRAFT_167715 [Immersiella caudata]